MKLAGPGKRRAMPLSSVSPVSGLLMLVKACMQLHAEPLLRMLTLDLPLAWLLKAAVRHSDPEDSSSAEVLSGTLLCEHRQSDCVTMCRDRAHCYPGLR